MVQWTEKPVKPQVAEPKQEMPPAVAPRQVRKASKSRLTGPLQVVTVLTFFGLLLGYFVYRGMPAEQSVAKREPAPVADRDIATGRIVVMDHRAECRELGFNNQSGRTVHKGQVSCHDTPAYHGESTPSLYRHPVNRLETIRRSFAQ
jgi:hypothetical protein